MRRLEVIDGLRGYCLVFMFLGHLNFTGGYTLVRLSHSELGFVQNAQGFVFLSGLLVGAVYGGRMVRKGFVVAAEGMWRRAAELYAYAIGCMIAILVLQRLLPHAQQYWEMWLSRLGGGAVAFRAAGAVLLYQPIFLDILPQYVVYLIAAPPLIWLCVTGRWLAVAVGSVLMWLAVQLGVHLPLADAVNAGLSRLDPELVMRVPFNVLAWQLVFFGAVVMGTLWAQGRIDFDRLFDPRETVLLKALATLLLFFMVFRLAFTFELVPESVLRRFQVYESRPEFGPVSLVNFVALGYVTAWLLIAGPRSERWPLAWIGRALTFVFNLSFLRLLGRNSLQVYAWHVILVYLVVWLDGYAGPFSEIAKTVIALSGVLAMATPALYLEWRKDRRQRSVAGGNAAPAS
jgi:hypothetical protein